MDFLKNILLKIIACICCTQNQKIPKEEQQASPESQEQKIELSKQSQEVPDFTELIKSKIARSNLNQKEHQTLLEAHEKTNEISKLLKIYFKYDQTIDQQSSRMFNGSLSSREQGQLFLGIEQANHLTIEDAIKHGANINGTINGLDPLQYAIRHGKDHIIEFLLENGAAIKPYHIELAQSYKIIYEANLNDNDLQFFCNNNQQRIVYEIRQYEMIANLLRMELNRRQREKNAQESINPQPKAMPKNNLITTGTTTSSSTLITSNTAQTQHLPLSSRPRFAASTSTATTKPSAQNDDDDI